MENKHALPATVLLRTQLKKLRRCSPGELGLWRSWCLEALPAGGRGVVVAVFLVSLPSLEAWEEDRSLSLTEEGGAIIGSTVNLSLIRRHAKLKGPGVIPQMSAY